MKLYFAAPLFSSAELNFNLRLTERIEALGLEVFLPQRDGILSPEPESPEEKNRAIFAMDRQRIFDTDIFLYVMDGRVPDEGAAVALGMAHSYKTLRKEGLQIIGLHTDSRASFTDSRLNPMLFSPLDFLAGSEEELLDFLDRETD
jgi:nucleoside 2-deoxyribosyltransferase